MTADRCNRVLTCTFLLGVLWRHCLVSPAMGQRLSDRVRLARVESGEVSDMTQTEITLNKGLPGNRPIAVNQIRSVVFDGEPSELSQARINAANGNYQKALDALEKIDVAAIRRDFIKQDIEFYKAFCAGKLALSGERRDCRRGPAAQQLCPRLSQEFSLPGSDGTDGRPVDGGRPIRAGTKTIRRARQSAVARLQNPGRRGGWAARCKPRASTPRRSRNSMRRLRCQMTVPMPKVKNSPPRWPKP